MSTPGAVHFQAYADGQEVLAADLENDHDATRNLVAEAIASFLGVYDALPAPTAGGAYGDAWVPLAVTASGVPDMNVHIVGTNMYVFAQGRMIDNCPSFTQAIPSNSSGQTRVDLISIQYQKLATLPSNPTTREFEATDQTLSTQSVYLEQETAAYTYTQGTPGSGAPAAPAGYTAFATITVANGAVSITNGNIAALFPTYATLLSSLIGAGVSSLNGLVGALSITAGTGISVTPSGSNIALANTGVITVAGGSGTPASGAILLSPSTGIAITQTAGTITFTNVGVTSLNSLTGAVSIAAGTGIVVTPSGSTITVALATSYIGMSVASHGTTADNAMSTNISLVLPSGGTWDIFIDWHVLIGPHNAGSMSITHVSGTMNDFSTPENQMVLTSNTTPGNIFDQHLTAIGTGVGGNTLTFNLACSISTAFLGNWTIRATRVT